MTESIIQLIDAHKSFDVGGMPFGRRKVIHAVRGVSFSVPRGTTFGLVGESGSGKSTIARMILGAETITEGDVFVAGQNIRRASRQDLRELRRNLQAVLQDPYGALNPRMRVGAIIGEPLIIHRVLQETAAVRTKVLELLSLVGLPADSYERFPNEMSGGQRQRVAIARALALQPPCLVLDEPVSALDVSIQAQILNLLKELQKQFNLTYLLISHDLSVISFMSTNIGVLYLGEIVETGTRDDVVRQPTHPYTQALLAAAEPETIELSGSFVLGEPPSPFNPPSGCPYHPRCPLADNRCTSDKPELRLVFGGHLVACHHAERATGLIKQSGSNMSST